MANAILVGAGEYTTGFVHGAASASDKKIGVVGLVMFDLRRRGLVKRIAIVDVDGTRFPGVREHFAKNIAARYREMDTSFESFPDDSVQHDAAAYLRAFQQFPAGAVVTIFVPDIFHFEIAKAAIIAGHHVLIAKPAVQHLRDHMELTQLAEQTKVLAAVEFHKRWDPCYADAIGRMRDLGSFSYFSAYMSQPKLQLHTFKAWAGRHSDISFYLNSHHIDVHCCGVRHTMRPVGVHAAASVGIANEVLGVSDVTIEDTITLLTTWEERQPAEGSACKLQAHAVYTASWTTPKTDVHSQQQFHYLASKGEIRIDQAHRGYVCASDSDGYASINPLYMCYTPDRAGYFAGQNGYGYKSIEAFVDAAMRVNAGKATPEECCDSLATLATTAEVTAILEAGRMSLDVRRPVRIVHAEDG
eukprot:CAMPEP_0177630878 /NCGR_PEP_ID=MMETSP0447-20121125/1449_1 /TAXON_ID=0 /ORGANISM="Stygamoeba regulata, Strain BSH-02190019" /LENGTH=414 /DNA_ID=CAMNT_0019132321 /DNA_START=37 /DNA_END=1278 /DNA_ORIENTATION=-